MDEYEQLFRDGLRQAVRHRPTLAAIDPAEVTAREASADERRTPGPLPVAEPPKPPVAQRHPAVRWAIGLAAAAAAAGLLVLPGGVGGRPIEAVPAQSPTPEETATPTPTPSAEPTTRWASSVTPAPDELPLTRYWDALRKAEEYEDALVSDAEVEQWQHDKQAFVGACMADHGFEYFPEARRPAPEAGSEEAAFRESTNRNHLRIPALDADREVVARIGYGVRSSADVLRAARRSRGNSRNTEYVASLSAAEQREYAIAMNGQADDDLRINPMTEGCWWEAERAHPDPMNRYWDDLVSNRFEVVMDLAIFRSSYDDSTLEADPRLVELNAEWRACMIAAGVLPEEAGAGAGTPDPQDGPQAGYDLALRTGADGVVAEPGDRETSREDQRSLVGSEAEIRIALTDYDCRVSTDYLNRLIEAQRDWEQEFVDAHRKQLDKMVAYVESR